MTDEIVTGLWSHLFAGLMVVGESGISNSATLMLSRKVSPIPSEVCLHPLHNYFKRSSHKIVGVDKFLLMLTAVA